MGAAHQFSTNVYIFHTKTVVLIFCCLYQNVSVTRFSVFHQGYVNMFKVCEIPKPGEQSLEIRTEHGQ